LPVCRKGGNGEWGAPSLFSIGGVSAGWRAGGKATDAIFLVMNPEGKKKLVQDSVKLGAELSVAAARQVVQRKVRQTFNSMQRFSATRDHGGYLAGVTLDGTVYKQDRDGN